MSTQADDTAQDSDPFRLHYREGNQRCVTSYDTIEGTLESARRKLAKRPEMELWISDASKRVLLDGSSIRARLAEGDSPDRPVN